MVSQKQYSDWKELQDEFDDYIANVDFNSIEEIKYYITSDYKLTDKKAIKEFRKISDYN